MGGNDYMVLKTDPKLSVLTAAYKMTFMTMVLGNFTTVIKEVYSLGREEVCFPERRADRVHACHPSILGDRRLPSRPVRASKDAQHRSVKAAEEAGLSARRILARALRPLHLRHSANSVQLEIRIQVMEKRVLRERAVQRELHLWMRQERTAKYNLCGHPSEFVWFDPGRPTESANRQLASLLWNGPARVVGPYNLKMFFNGSS